MFTHDILPIAKVAIEHSEWYTLNYLLSQLYGWMDSPDVATAKDAAEVGHYLIAAMEGNDLMRSKYGADIYRIHNYLDMTVKWLENGKQ